MKNAAAVKAIMAEGEVPLNQHNDDDTGDDTVPEDCVANDGIEYIHALAGDNVAVESVENDINIMVGVAVEVAEDVVMEGAMIDDIWRRDLSND